MTKAEAKIKQEKLILKLNNQMYDIENTVWNLTRLLSRVINDKKD